MSSESTNIMSSLGSIGFTLASIENHLSSIAEELKKHNENLQN